jgi:rSAM/selenodomain-associated transferase 2
MAARQVRAVVVEVHCHNVMTMQQTICSIIIPVLNDAPALSGLLDQLSSVRQQGHEVIVVDGGSTDDSVLVCRDRVDHLIEGKAGRSAQMNLGAENAAGDIFWFLHADSKLDSRICIQKILKINESPSAWGRFNVRLSGSDWRFRVIENMMNWRSAFTGIATGDQAIFVSRSAFEKTHGYADIPLMEDIDLSRRLKKISSPMLCSQLVTTSSRRWENNGIVRTIFLMWFLRLAFALGVNPAQLNKFYGSCN